MPTLQDAIRYARQYRRNGKSCYVRSADRERATFTTNRGTVEFVPLRCRYAHGGRSKWWRAYLRFVEAGKAVPSKLFGELVEV